MKLFEKILDILNFDINERRLIIWWSELSEKRSVSMELAARSKLFNANNT